MATDQTTIAPGQKFTVKGGMTITPIAAEVEVVWVDADTVWYRKGSLVTVLETPRARFMEIVQNV